METLARMTPGDYAFIIGMALFVMLTQMLWGWREPIVAFFRQWSVNDRGSGYVTGDETDQPATTATTPVAATSNEPLRRIAMQSNEDNEPLTRNGRNPVLRARAGLIARLLKSESLYVRDTAGNYRRVTQTGLIELSTGLKANGRPESDYGQLRAELEPLINPQIVISAGQPGERVISKV